MPELNVIAVGSCRIFRPLRGLRELNLLNASEGYWFTHTAASARQYVDAIQGRIEIPHSHREPVIESVLKFPGDLKWTPRQPASVAVVEVSSLRQHRLDGFELNAHKVYGLASTATQNYRPILYGDTSSLPEDHVLKAMTVSLATTTGIEQDLLSIKRHLGVPLLVVDHIYSEMPNGAQVPERTALTQILRTVASENGFGFYETRATILEHGIDSALEDQNHYRPEFEAVVGASLLRSVCELLG